MATGKFITFEGGEGSGKSTQARLLAETLRGRALDVVVTREPGGTPLGESIRELILANRPALDAEFLLFAAARAEHVVQKILRAARKGTRVILIPGNHDEGLRDYCGAHFGGIEIVRRD